VVHGVGRGAAAPDLPEFLHLLQSDIDFNPGLHGEASQDGIRFLAKALSPSWAFSFEPGPPARAADPSPRRSCLPAHSNPGELSRWIETNTPGTLAHLVKPAGHFVEIDPPLLSARSLGQHLLPANQGGLDLLLKLFDLPPRAGHYGDESPLAAIYVQQRLAHTEFAIGHV
jgi:hypothetical protein